MCFPRHLPFCRQTRQRPRFGNLLGTNFFGSQIGRAFFGCDPLTSKLGKLFLPLGSGNGRQGKLGRCKFTMPDIRQSALLGLDSRSQGNFGQPFDMGLLRHLRLRLLFGGSTAEGMLGSKIFGALTPLRGHHVLGGKHLARLGSSSSPIIRGGTRQGIRLGSPFGVCRVGGGGGAVCRELSALPFQFLQIIQDLAQVTAPFSRQCADF